MDVRLRKVTARVDFKAGDASAGPQSRSRPGSPTKYSPTSLSPSAFHPKAKVKPNATLRKLTSSSSLTAPRSNNVSTPAHSRPGSPLRPSRVLQNQAEPSSSPKARVTARPTSQSGISPVQTNLGSQEPRQRALTSASAKLKLPYSEDRPRSGSVVALHHSLPVLDLNTPPSPTLSSQPPPSAESPLVDTRRTNTPPVLAPIKIKSKVTDFVKSTSTNAGDSVSRSLSPPYATTRPIHTRSRAPSITSFSLNDPPPLSFYPITTASPAANPHRYAPRRAPSPARPYPSPTLSNEPNSAKRSLLFPKVDPALVPLPPQSPPISALSISSKSSVSKTPVSLNGNQMADNQVRIVSHVKRRSMEWIGQPNPFFPQAEIKIRDRSHSKERSPRDTLHRAECDTESEGSERQLKAEAKTNRKIADLEITNRSLLAINASLETTKNRQAKEIRDLRRKLRESRLILPPRTYKAVTSTSDDEDEDDDDSDVEGEEDATFQRVRGLIDSLIESGKRALETRPEDFQASLATKVLNADELRSWRDSGQRTSTGTSSMDKQDADDETIHGHPSPVVVAIPDSGSTSSVESDGELASDAPGSPALPPITITHSL